MCSAMSAPLARQHGFRIHLAADVHRGCLGRVDTCPHTVLRVFLGGRECVLLWCACPGVESPGHQVPVPASSLPRTVAKRFRSGCVHLPPCQEGRRGSVVRLFVNPPCCPPLNFCRHHMMVLICISLFPNEAGCPLHHPPCHFGFLLL